MTRPVVFLGPSLPLDDARRIVDADFRGPVAQGDVLRGLASRPPAIAIIDGVFRHTATVRHRDILWALGSGVPVFGAASMGALRAAEVPGMIGVGLIYRWYRRYALLADDAVAVAHAPPQLGSAPLSVALVDIRRSVARAVRAGAVTAAAGAGLRAAAEATRFEDRQHLVAPPWQVDQKRADATALLHRLAAHVAAGRWPQPIQPLPPITDAWTDDLAAAGLEVPVGPPE